MAVKPLKIGIMRSVVVFLTNTPTTAATATLNAVTTGGQNDVYSTLLSTRGRLKKLNGGRMLEMGMIQSEDAYELTCRFQTALETALKVNGKVTVDGAAFTINTWEKMDQINHIYKFKINSEVGS